METKKPKEPKMDPYAVRKNAGGSWPSGQGLLICVDLWFFSIRVRCPHSILVVQADLFGPRS